MDLPEIENHWIVILYTLGGFGSYGGYRGWSTPARLLYFCLFPIHWAVISLWSWQDRNPDEARNVCAWIGLFIWQSIVSAFVLAVLLGIFCVIVDSMQ